MKKISILTLTVILFFSSVNISFAFEQKTNTNDIFSGISNIFKVQYELYQKTKYNVINVCNLVVVDMLSLKTQNNTEMSFIDLQKQFVGAETALLPPNTVVLCAKFFTLNYKTEKVPLTASFVLFFVCIFLLRYLGLLRVFWSAAFEMSKYFKKAYVLYMLSFIFGKKTVSLITVACFLFSVLAADLSAAVLNDKSYVLSETVELFSKDSGKITETVNNNSDLLVINIQDLHSNPSVQLNIKNILASIDKKYKIKQIFIEGGYGDVDISWLYKIPDLKDRNNFAESLLASGRLTGSEYFAYKTGADTVLKGLEDEQIHKNNLKALSAIMDRQGFYNARLQKVKADIEFLNASQASNKNLRLNKIVARHNNGSVDTAKFYKLLLKTAKEINKNPKDYRNIMPVDLALFPNINKYININFSKINKKKLSDEINLFLNDIKNRVSYAEYSEIVKNTDGFSDAGRLVRNIQSLSSVYKIDLSKKYPVLYVYTNISILAESINPVKLINEERVLLNNLRQAFSKNSTEYEVSFLADFYDIFKKYLTNSLTADEYEYFSSKFIKFKEIYSKYAVVDRLTDLKPDFDMLNSYYCVNNLRNDIFINNILAGRNIKHENTGADTNVFDGSKEIIVIVAGGFHTKGIGKLLNDRKISYMTITPNVKSPIAQSEKYYREIVKDETAAETNALSFTVASCASDFMQFKWGIVSAIQYLNKEYSKENIEKIVENMRYLVKDKITLQYSQAKTEIAVGDRKIILLNYNGKMRSSDDVDENKFKPTSNKINSFGINALFEKYPAIDLSNGGLEFKLRHLEKLGITEIKGIDLAVIARLPSLFQEYLFETLPAEIKAKSEELVIIETIKKHDKTPALLEELEKMFIERTKATGDYLQLKQEILPMHLQILWDRSDDIEMFINPLKRDLKELLKSNINQAQYTYITAVLFFISAMTEDFSDSVNMTDKRCNIELLKEFMAVGVVPASAVEKYVDNEIKSGSISESARQKRIAVIDEIARLDKNPASILGSQYKDLAHKWEWIYNIPFSSFISLFIKKHGIKSIARQEVFEQSISLTEKPAALFVFDALSSLAIIAGTAFAIVSGIFPIVAISAVVYSVTRGIIFSKSHGLITDKNAKTEIGVYGGIFALASVIPVLIGLYAFPVMVPVLIIAGQFLSSAIHKSYNSGLIKAYINGAKIKTSQIIAAVLIIATLAGGTILINNYFNYSFVSTEYAQVQQEIINIQSDRFEIIFSGYLKNTHLTEQEKSEINTLRDFFASNIDRSSYEKFLESLLYIRSEITSTDSILTPSIDAGFSLYVWKDIVQDLDEMISDNFTEIQKNKNLNKMLSPAYSPDEVSYLEILSLRDDSEALIKIINGQKDMHYRFYAFMLLNAKDHISADAFFNKDDILKYLDGKYIFRDPLSLADINNSFQWQAMCAMMNFITGAGEDYSSMLHDARVVRPGGPQISNAGLAYVISGDGTVSPIFVAAHEVAHIRFLNILGIHDNTDGYKISELYAELEAARIEEKISVTMQYTGDKRITDLKDDTDNYTVAYAVIEEVRNKVGIDSLNLLQDAIIEFLQARGEKPAENIQKTMKEVVEIFAAKVADSRIASGVISESQRQDKIKEIIDSLISEQPQSETPVSLPAAASSHKPAEAAVFPYGLIAMMFAGITDRKNKKIKYKHFNYIVAEFEKEGTFFKRFKKVFFKDDENGLTALYKHGFFGKTETVFLSNDISKEEAYTLIKGLIAEYLPTDLQGNLHYYTQFFKRDIRGTVYAPLFKYAPDGKYGFVINILKDKISKGDRTFRFWSCGSATGEELRTFAWFVRKTLIDLNENPNEWKLDFYGTDNNKTTAEIASSFTGSDIVENKEVEADMSGFNVRYVILDHTNMTDLKNWLIWQKEEGGFDLICQLNNPTPQQQQEAVAKEVMHPYSIYVHHNQMYDASASQIKIEKSFSDAITVNDFFGAMPEVKTKSKKDANSAFIGLTGFFKDLIDAVFSKDLNKQKTAVIYQKIFADNIFYNNSKPEISDGVVFAPVFVIEGVLDANSARELNLKPAGIKINDEPLYYALVKNVLYLYAEGCSYNDIVASVQESTFIKKQISVGLNKSYGRRIKSKNIDIQELKISKGGLQSLKYNKAGIVEITLNNLDSSRIKEMAVSYIDSTARYGFAVRESVFRYIDDFNVSADKKDRISNFINIIKYQKNISCQFILDYEVYKQLVSDMGLEKFNEILSQAKEKNVSVYIFVSSELQKKDLSDNSLLYGFIEHIDGRYFITDNFTKDSSEAAFASDCDSVEKMINFMEANITKQPVIFKNSLIKKAVDSEQDTLLSGMLREIFSAGRLINTISAAKSKYSAGKIVKTFSVKELSESFDDANFDIIKKLYGTYVNLSDGEELKAKLYSEITALLGMNNASLKRFFDINTLSDKTDSGGTASVFIDLIIFRIAAAKQLAIEGKTTGLKNREYEDILAKALKIMIFDIGNDTGEDMDAEVIRLAAAPNSYEREKNLAEYLKNNIGMLTQRAFSKAEPDARAVNTLIFLIPFAEANDIEIDITKLAVDQSEVINKTKAFLAAA